MVAQVEHVSGHIIENDRIGIIEVPLIGIEGGHDDFAGLFAPGEVSGSGLGKDLGNSLFKLVGDIPVIIEEIPVLIFLLACAGALRPLVVLTGVVHDEVKAEAHTLAVALVAEGGQVFHGAERGLYLAEIGNRVSAVAASRGALQKRHQMQVVQAAFLQIVKMFLHTLQSPCEAVGVHEHAQHLISLVPFRHLLSGLIPLLQDRASLRIILVEHVAEILKGLLIIVIELGIQPFHLIIMLFQALRKFGFPVLSLKHLITS